MKKEKLTCYKHPDYQAERPPKADCLECRLMYRATKKHAEALLSTARSRAQAAVDVVNTMLREKVKDRGN